MNYFDDDQFAVPAFDHTEESLRFKQQLIDFIENEVVAEESEVRRKHKLRTEKRVEISNCITGLKFQGIENGSYTYSYSSNKSNFRDGEILVINDCERRGHDVLNEGVLVWLKQIDHHRKQIKLDQALEIELPQADDCVLDRGFYDYNSARLRQSVNLAYALDVVPKLIEGRAIFPLNEHLLVSEMKRLQAGNSTLTQRQCAAVASAKHRHLTLIQGPPGTGKTHVLTVIIEAALLAGQSVLVTGPSHPVIDSLLDSISRRDVPAQIVKITSRQPRLDRKVLEIEHNDLRLNELVAPYVVGATAYKDYKLIQNANLNFDLVVIDEAGQMPVVHGVPALLNADRVVIAGDHKQLAPIIHAPERHPAHLNQSLFELMHTHYPLLTHLLDVTFRMNRGINEFPSSEFYGGSLKPASTVARRTFAAAHSACGELSQIITREEAVTFIELDHEDVRQHSDFEAGLVAQLATELIKHHDQRIGELAIIAPLKAHNERIRRKFGSLVKNDRAMRDLRYWELFIDTVHRIQGQERETIILSLCASDRRYLVNCANLFFDPHLLNVAITRSKTRLFIIGSKNFFPHNAGIIIDTRYRDLWQRFYNYLVSNDHRVIYAPADSQSEGVGA